MPELGNLLWDKTTTISSKDTELQKLKDYLNFLSSNAQAVIILEVY